MAGRFYATRSKSVGLDDAVIGATLEGEADIERLLALPSRRELGWKKAHKDAPDFVVKLSSSKSKRVYEKYFDYKIATPRFMADSYKRRMLEAHYWGLIGVAYLECHCQHCRFVSIFAAPHSAEYVAEVYELYYDTQIADMDVWRASSPCLIVQVYQQREEALALQQAQQNA